MEKTIELIELKCPACKGFTELSPERNVAYCYHCDLDLHLVCDWTLNRGLMIHIAPCKAGERLVLESDKYSEVPLGERAKRPQVSESPRRSTDMSELLPGVETPNTDPDPLPGLNPDPLPDPNPEYEVIIRQHLADAPDQTATTSELADACKHQRATFSHNSLNVALKGLQQDGDIRRLKRGLYQLC